MQGVNVHHPSITVVFKNPISASRDELQMRTHLPSDWLVRLAYSTKSSIVHLYV